MKSGIKHNYDSHEQSICEQGNIVLVPFPFTDLSAKKLRPVLIISNNKYNGLNKDFICCGITSNIKDEDYSIFIDVDNLSFGFLSQPSRIKLGKIATLEQSLIIKTLAKVNTEIMKKVKDELFRLF